MSIPAPWLDSACPEKRSYMLESLVPHLIDAERWVDVCRVLTDPAFLEAKAEAGMVFGLASDFAAALKAMPEEQRRRGVLRLLGEALRRDIHFIAQYTDSYPQALFQCMWNTCWWYDCPEGEQHYEAREDEGDPGSVPWGRDELKLFELMERWRRALEASQRGVRWVRSLRPPYVRLSSAQETLFNLQGSEIVSLAWTPGGGSVASSSVDGRIHVLDLLSSKVVDELKIRAGYVRALAFSADGTTALMLTDEGAIARCDASLRSETTFTEIAALKPLRMAVCPTGSLVAVTHGVGDPRIQVWDYELNRLVLQIPGHSDDTYSIAYAPDGSFLASGGDDGCVRVWDTRSGAEFCALEGHVHNVLGVAFSPDGLMIASVSMDQTARIWSTADRHCTLCIKGHEGAFTSVAWSPCGLMLASACADNTIRIWDSSTGEELFRLEGHVATVNCIVWSLWGRRVISGSDDGTVRVWNLSGDVRYRRLDGHRKPIRGVMVTPDGTSAVSTSDDGTARVWDLHKGRTRLVVEGLGVPMSALAFDPQRNAVVCSSEDNSVHGWDPSTGEQVFGLGLPWAGTGPVAALHDGRIVVTGGACGCLHIVDPDSGKELTRISAHRDRVTKLAVSPDGKRMASAGGYGDGTVRVWDTETGDELLELKGHYACLLWVGFAHNGSSVVTRDADSQIRFWHSGTGECTRTLDSSVCAPAEYGVGLSGNYRLTKDQACGVVVDVQTGEVVGRFPQYMHAVHASRTEPIWAAFALGCPYLYALKLEEYKAASATASDRVVQQRRSVLSVQKTIEEVDRSKRGPSL